MDGAADNPVPPPAGVVEGGFEAAPRAATFVGDGLSFPAAADGVATGLNERAADAMRKTAERTPSLIRWVFFCGELSGDGRCGEG